MTRKLEHLAQLVRNVYQEGRKRQFPSFPTRTPCCPTLERVHHALSHEGFSEVEKIHIEQCKFCQLLIYPEQELAQSASPSDILLPPLRASLRSE